MFDEEEPSEEEREDLFLDTGEHKSTITRESRKEREAKLKQMMEDDGKLAPQENMLNPKLNLGRRR